MERSEGFAPVVAPDARVLILGSLPGRKSIQEQQYYAHSRNAFWPIMREVLGIDGEYEDRCRGLIENRVALWDVLRASVRPGSLDADIRANTATVNDFAWLLRKSPHIRSILFNGKKAETMFARMIGSTDELTPRLSTVRLHSLPSTSPAYAAMPFSGKLAAWREALLDDAAREQRRSR
jgi:hypoxanthine-DNA glycosylase